jgi:formylmethanofuran dehydrogenase subunit E
MKQKISLNEAVNFHGHLGPYLVLGLRAGEIALKKLNCKKYFGLDVKVWGANQKPKSCLVDGLQLATGATYGKGNIQKAGGAAIKIQACNRDNHQIIILTLKDEIVRKLKTAATHQECEALAKQLYRKKYGAFRIRHL